MQKLVRRLYEAKCDEIVSRGELRLWWTGTISSHLWRYYTEVFARDSFFTPGGTLPPNSASYVRRKADEEILEALLKSELVYVLDSRQKGKSSLIVRAIADLKVRGVRTARIDFQRLGNNLLPEQWYAGLLHSIGQELGKTEELFEFWKSNLVVGPAFRFFAAIEAVLIQGTSEPLVIFVDEVDFCQALPFSVDEFFAGIRQLYNRRSESTDFERVTFCLVGVASPSQLINNQDVTPFNVGRRVEVTDFTREEIEPYGVEIARSGRNGKKLVDRIFYWVSGHPYLTQVLAGGVAARAEIRHPADVDAYVRTTLFSAESRQREPNIADAERRLLQTRLPNQSADESRSQILELHALMLTNSLVPARHDEPAVLAMLLSGIAIEEAGSLRFRNRLYRTLFDERWRRNSLPDAEAQRQRVASFRGALRAVWISAACFAVLACFVVWLILLASSRDRALAESRRQSADRSVIAYQTSIALASETLREGNQLKALALLRGQTDASLRGWEWNYLKYGLPDPTEIIPPSPMSGLRNPIQYAWLERGSLATVRSGSLFLGSRFIGKFQDSHAASYGVSWLWATKDRASLDARYRTITQLLATSPKNLYAIRTDAKQVAVIVGTTNQIELRDVETGTTKVLQSPTRPYDVSYSGDGRFLSIRGLDSQMTYDFVKKLWIPYNLWPSPKAKYMLVVKLADSKIQVRRVEDNSLVSELKGHTAPPSQAIWFADETRLVTCAHDHTVRVWNVKEGRELAVYASDKPGASISLSPDERSIFYVTMDGSLVSWPVTREHEARVLTTDAAEISSIKVSPDGSRCIGYVQNGMVGMIDLKTGTPIAHIPIGKFPEAPATVFSPDGKILLMVCSDGNILFANPFDGRILRKIAWSHGRPYSVAISASGNIALTLRDSGVLLMDSWKGNLRTLSSVKGSFSRAALSKDGNMLALGGQDGSVFLVDTRSDKVIYKRQLHSAYITGVEFSPSGHVLSIASRDGTASLLNLDSLGEVKVLSGHTSRIWQARFSPNEKWILTNSFDGTARVWDTATGKTVSILQHDSWVSSAEWSPDSRRIVTGCADHLIRVFAPENGFELLKLRGNTGFVLGVTFTPDGNSILSCGEDHTLRIWQSGPMTPSRL